MSELDELRQSRSNNLMRWIGTSLSIAAAVEAMVVEEDDATEIRRIRLEPQSSDRLEARLTGIVLFIPSVTVWGCSGLKSRSSGLRYTPAARVRRLYFSRVDHFTLPNVWNDSHIYARWHTLISHLQFDTTFWSCSLSDHRQCLCVVVLGKVSNRGF